MELLSIIVDRVGSTNVFNIIQGRLPTRETHLQTVVDWDLIEEFLAEVEKLNRISNSLSESERVPDDIPSQMKRIGETFFLQFFPEEIQDRIRAADQGFLFLHVDHRLRSIPWELLHDGQTFLAERFFMGKNISGFWRDVARPERERLRVLIIADPTEDLEWARAEGEALFESLNAEVSADRIDVQVMAGRAINKLGLLNALKDRDIIHFAGHLSYSPDSQESGWLLSEGKVLRAREIEKAGYAPDLVFSNSCFSSPAAAAARGEEKPALVQSRFNDMAGAFLTAGIYNYIGTNWEIKDSGFTLDFALNFYRAIFEEKTVGEALFEARSHARRTFPSYDLTWANYVLHGNPMTRIYRSGSRKTFDASRNVQTAQRIVSRFPLPVAVAYEEFHSDEGTDSAKKLGQLSKILEVTIKTVGAFALGNYRFLNRKGDFHYAPAPLDIWLERIFEVFGTMRSVQMELAQSGVMEALVLHRENLQKLLAWREAYLEKDLSTDAVETYVITFQYILDNVLVDLSALSRGQFLYIDPGSETAYVLHGAKPWVLSLARGEFRDRMLRERIVGYVGKVCFYSGSRQLIFPLDGFMESGEKGRDIRFPAFEFNLYPEGPAAASAMPSGRAAPSQ